MTGILTYDFPLLSCDCLPCAQPISCTQTWWVPDTIDQCEPQALNHTKSAESAPPYRPNEQACSGTHRAKKKKTHERKQIHAHTEPERTQTSTLRLSVTTHFTISHTNTITTAVVIQGLDASVEGWRHVVEAEQSCEENTDAQGKQC